MTIGQIMQSLIDAENYNEVRIGISDEFIEMAKVMLSDFGFIREKEEKYQELLKLFNSINSHKTV